MRGLGRIGRIAAAAVVAATGLAAPGAVAAAARPGAPAPALALPDLAGRPVALAALRGRIVVVDFWASWCAPCAAVLPALDALARRFPPSEVTVLAVSVDRSRDAAATFIAERLRHPALTVLHDRGSQALARWGAPGLPATYVVDRAGTVRLVEHGADPDGLAAVARTVAELAARPPADAPVPANRI